MKSKKSFEVLNSKAIFQVVNGFLFTILLIITFIIDPINSYGILILGAFLILTAIIRFVFKIPVRGIGNMTFWDSFGHIATLFLGSIFLIIGICAVAKI